MGQRIKRQKDRSKVKGTAKKNGGKSEGKGNAGSKKKKKKRR